MKIIDVVNQLQAALPLYTDAFSDELSVISLSSSGTTATCVTTVAHGLSTNDIVVINDAFTPNDISSLTQINNVATAITVDSHDLTENYQTTVTISGATEADYNGEQTLLSVPNRKTFTYEIENNPTSPATGLPKLLYKYVGVGYNGVHAVTVIDPTTFTFTLERSFGSPAFGDITLRVRTRISGAVNVDRAMDCYTKQNPNDLWAFVVLNPSSASKDRRQHSDVTAQFGTGEAYRQTIISPFSVYLFIPSTNSIAAREEVDTAQDELVSLCKSLLNLKFPSGFVEVPYAGCVFSGDSSYAYTPSYYVHQFDFEASAYIVYDDTVAPDYNVAFRDIDLKMLNYFDLNDNVIAETTVDLDDEPLT